MVTFALAIMGLSALGIIWVGATWPQREDREDKNLLIILILLVTLMLSGGYYITQDFGLQAEVEVILPSIIVPAPDTVE